MKQRTAGWVLTATCVLLLGLLANAQTSGPVGPPTPAPPVITGLYPASAKAGSISLLVFVTGQNFVRGVTMAEFIRSDGTAVTSAPIRPTIVFNSQVLAFEATASDLQQPGTASVKVLNDVMNKPVTVSNQLPFVVLP